MTRNRGEQTADRNRIEGIARGAAAASIFVSGPALAHHAMDGETPTTLLQGLVSGLAHPVIGLDHLAFVIGVGLLAGLAGRSVLVPLAFVGATLAGACLHLAGMTLPAAELVIGITVVFAAALVFAKLKVPASLLAALFAVSGLFHGYAYGESIVGAEPTPLAAYLLGFMGVQFAIAAGSAAAAKRAAGKSGLRESVPYRMAGLGIGVVGLSAVLSAV